MLIHSLVLNPWVHKKGINMQGTCTCKLCLDTFVYMYVYAYMYYSELDSSGSVKKLT